MRLPRIWLLASWVAMAGCNASPASPATADGSLDGHVNLDAAPDGAQSDSGTDAAPDVRDPDSFTDAAVTCSRNGVVEAEEECDDGNDVATDACTNACRWAICGDGIVRAGAEQCDDSNTDDGDTCSSQCLSCDHEADARLHGPGGHCYTRHDIGVGYTASQTACLSFGGHLATYATRSENEVVALGLTAGAGGPWWIGLYAAWAWEDRTTPVFSNWAAGEPVSNQGNQRGAMAADGPWYSREYRSLLGYICEIDGWVLRPEDNHAYRFYYDPVTWPQAKARCEAAGAHLVTLNSTEEDVFVSALIHEGIWLGFTDTAVEGTYEWVTGELFDAETAPWASNEPDNLITENCGYTNRSDGWHDVGCSRLERFICEID